MINETRTVILFDGVCHLCNNWVRFIINRDKKKQFYFAPLQSDYAQGILAQRENLQTLPDSVILIHSGVIYTESEAALRILKLLGGLWRIPALGIFVPKFIRQWVYRTIALNRYRWFGKYDSCQMPKPEWKSRFLN
jgi:predicted DCC family thiol-disulfide oxidoreductase YuxK